MVVLPRLCSSPGLRLGRLTFFVRRLYMATKLRPLLALLISSSLMAKSGESFTYHLFGHDKLVSYLEKVENPRNPNWLKEIQKAILERTPANIGKWNLSESRLEFSKRSNTIWKHDIYGIQMKFIYSSKEQKILIYHFFNPVHIKYPEMGYGYHVGFSAFQFDNEHVISNDKWKIFKNASWLASNSPSIDDADRNLFSFVNSEIYCCYGGKNWIVNRSNSMYHLGLSYRNIEWKNTIYGDICIISMPKDAADKSFVLRYLGYNN